MRFVFLLLLVFPSLAFGTELRIAVLDFNGIGVDDPALLSSLGDGVRTGLIKTIDTNSYLVMTRESTMQILKDMGKDASCLEGSCEVEIARNIGADYVVSGTVTLISGTYLATLKLHNTKTNALLSSEQVEDKDALRLIKSMAETGQRLLYEGGIGKRPIVTRRQISGFQEQSSGDDGSHRVRITSSPAGEDIVVLLDDIVICTSTPCSPTVPKGEHIISIQKDGYQPWTEARNLDEDLIISAELQSATAFLQVTTGATHDIRFVLNEEEFRSPLVDKPLREGRYILRFDDPCYTVQGEREYNFDLLMGERKEIAVVVSPVMVELEAAIVDTKGDVLDADLYVDGEYIGESTQTVQLPLCAKRLEARYQDLNEEVTLVLDKGQVNSTSIVFDLQRHRKRKQRQKMGLSEPQWNFTLGYRQGEEAVHTSSDLRLENGFIAFNQGGYLLDATVPAQDYFDRETQYGFQADAGVMWEQWYGELEFSFLNLAGNEIYPVRDSTGSENALVLDFQRTGIGFETGYVAPWPYLRPNIGLLLGGDIYTGNITEVGSQSSWANDGLVPYSVISTENDSEGDSITPSFQAIAGYVGASAGLFIQHPAWDEMPLGLHVGGQVKRNRIGTQYYAGLSFWYQVPIDP